MEEAVKAQINVHKSKINVDQSKIKVRGVDKIRDLFYKILLAAAVAFSVGAAAEAAVVDRIVAVVNDEVITLSELNRVFEPYRDRFDARYRGNDRNKALDEAKVAILNQMINNILMEQHAKKAGITVSEGEVKEAMADIRKQRNLSEEELLKLLEMEKIKPGAYEKEIRDQLMRMKLIGREIRSKAVATDGEIGEYYQKHRKDYEGEESIRIQQILLLAAGDAPPGVKAKIRADAEAIHKRLLAGEPFGALCAKFSQGPGAEEGGDIGYIERGAILPEIEGVAFSLPLNKISDVIESPIGFHIIQVTDRRGAGAKSIESVREEIKAKIDREKTEKKFEEWLTDLREKSNVEIRL